MKTNRRVALKWMGLSVGAAFVTPAQAVNSLHTTHHHTMLKGNIKHSVCRWPYSDIPFEDLCKAAKEIGIESIELTGIDEWPILKKYGLTCAIAWGCDLGIAKGFNDPANHAELLKRYTEYIPKVAKAGLNNLICFSGNRAGISDEQGLENCAKGLMPIIPIAEKHKVTLTMELLNSKIDHADYQCDHTAWGVALCKKVGSDRFKLLYDIYHMQIMEGDIIRTIRENIQYISHFHTGGNPGRNEIDETQELNYPAIMKAIVDTGYKGYVGQEFIPKNPNKVESLKKGVLICDV